MSPGGKDKTQVYQSLPQEMTYGHWGKGSSSSGVAKLLVAIFSPLGCMEEGYVQQKKIETKIQWKQS